MATKIPRWIVSFRSSPDQAGYVEGLSKFYLHPDFAVVENTYGQKKVAAGMAVLNETFVMRGKTKSTAPCQASIGNADFVTAADAAAQCSGREYTKKQREDAAAFRTVLNMFTEPDVVHVYEYLAMDALGQPIFTNPNLHFNVFRMKKPMDAAMPGPNVKYPQGFSNTIPARVLSVAALPNSEYQDGNGANGDDPAFAPISTPARDNVDNSLIDPGEDEWAYVMKNKNSKNDKRQAAMDEYYNYCAWSWNLNSQTEMANSAAWKAEIASPDRCSLIDGAEECLFASNMKLPLDTKPLCPSYSCKITSYYPGTGHPQVVELSGLTFCPISVYGQIIEFAIAPRWKKGYEGITRIITLADAAAWVNADPKAEKWEFPDKNGNLVTSGYIRARPLFQTTNGNPVKPPGPTPGGGDKGRGGRGGGHNNSSGGGNIPPTPSNQGCPVITTLGSNAATDCYRRYYIRWLKPFVRKLEAKHKDLGPLWQTDSQDHTMVLNAQYRNTLDQDTWSYLQGHTEQAWIGDITQNQKINIDKKMRHELGKLGVKVLDNRLVDLGSEYCDASVAYFWWVAGWDEDNMGPLPSRPKSLRKNDYKPNPYWDLLANGYNPMALTAIAAATGVVCFVVRQNNYPLWYIPASSVFMLGGYSAYVTYNTSYAAYKASLSHDWNDVKNGYAKAQSAGKTAETVFPYVAIGAGGLTLTAMLMYGTYHELGAASVEALGPEFIGGVAVTLAAEGIYYVHSQWNNIGNALGKIF